MRDVVIFGAGQIAEVAKVYFDRFGEDRVVGFTVDAAYKSQDVFHGLPVVAFEDLEAHFPPSQVKLIGPLSYRLMNEFRKERHHEARARGYRFANYVDPRSSIMTDAIGENCFILEANVIQPFATIGDGVMIWSGSHVGHHGVIGDFCFLSSHVCLGGGVRIRERCFLSGKSGVESGLTVGAGSFLGSGSKVRRNLPENSVLPGAKDLLASFTAERIKRLRMR